jgi:flagellar biosynthesis/type III secretory pathway chaperone
MTETLDFSQMVDAYESDRTLTADLLAHLATQIESAQRMLAVVREQGAAIRERNVPEVVQLATALQTEMHRRELLEADRGRLLLRAAPRLGVDPADITMKTLAEWMDPEPAGLALARTQELRSILEIIQREHNTNRALMQQELAFLDHLLRLAGSAGGYGTDGNQSTVRRRAPLLQRPVFDLEA